MLDHFRLTLANQTSPEALTKRALVSDIARTYDVLGWFAPAIIKLKILLQKVWESKIDWDDCVTQPVVEEWSLWRTQLKTLSQIHLPRCYFPKEVQIMSTRVKNLAGKARDAR